MPAGALLDTLFHDIEATFCSGSHDRRTAILMQVTDMFERTVRDHGGKAGAVFDDVMLHLINHVERRALVELSARLAPSADAPSNTLRKLAHHDAAEVAGPVLRHSECLSDRELVDIARTKSQSHLASIAARRTISEGVTDALVEHGDAEVAHVVAGNDGARLSPTGMAQLVIRAEGDDRLAESMSRRPDISPALFRQLLLQATDKVRERLLAENHDKKDMIRQIMDALETQAGGRARARRDYLQAQRVIAGFSQDTELMKSKVQEFAGSNRHAELIASLAVLSGLSIAEVDRMFNSANEIGLTVLGKSVGLTCEASYAVLVAASGAHDDSHFADFSRGYDELSIASAQRILRFWQGRQRVAQHFERRSA